MIALYIGFIVSKQFSIRQVIFASLTGEILRRENSAGSQYELD